jgi:hypothetical protein
MYFILNSTTRNHLYSITKWINAIQDYLQPNHPSSSVKDKILLKKPMMGPNLYELREGDIYGVFYYYIILYYIF